MKEYDVIVVGSGAGGSTVAREMTNTGRKVLLLEQGGRVNMMGNTLTVALILKYFGLTRSVEKNTVVFADNYGGLSNLTAGCAAAPPKIVFDPVGIDLSAEAEEARREMHVQQLPDHLLGKSNLRLLEAAHDAGFSWEKMQNFIDPEKCVENCGQCMLGCKTGAKWTARVFGDEAVSNGADLKLHTRVKQVIMENGKAAGVVAVRFGRERRYYAKCVVLSAGTGNVGILRDAGIQEAGQGFCCDWLQFAGGIIPDMNTVKANPMSVGTMEHYESDGLVVLPVFPNWSQFAVLLGMTGMKNLALFPDFWKYTGLMVKIRDDAAGEIYSDTKFSKPITPSDQQKLDKGIGIIKKILRKAGAADDSFMALKPSGAHPSATCRIGEVVDRNLETRIPNLFCCDSSVFPTSLGLPVVWTAVSMSKRLAKHLDGRI